MPARAMGIISGPADGSLVQASSMLDASFRNSYRCQTVYFEQWEANTGKIYIFDDPSGSKTTGAHLLFTIAVPTLNTGNKATNLPSKSVSVPNVPGVLNVNEFWIGFDNATEKCTVMGLG